MPTPLLPGRSASVLCSLAYHTRHSCGLNLLYAYSMLTSGVAGMFSPPFIGFSHTFTDSRLHTISRAITLGIVYIIRVYTIRR